MPFNVMNGAGLGAGADFLQQMLAQKFEEGQKRRAAKLAEAKLVEDARQANMQNETQRGSLALGGRRVDEDVRQFDAQAPVRGAQVSHLGAETESLNRQPAEAEKQREFLQSQSQTQQTFQGGQGDLNRQNAIRIANINGVNAARVAGLTHPQAGQTAQQQNEVSDAIALIDQITNDPALATAVGPVDQYIGKARDLGGVNRFEALHNQLVGKLSLAQAGKLKGQGQISDKERAMLAAAATALTRGLQEPDYRNELTKIRGQFERMNTAGGAVHPVAAPTGGPAVGTVKTFPNGKTGVWDGQGWVQQ